MWSLPYACHHFTCLPGTFNTIQSWIKDCVPAMNEWSWLAGWCSPMACLHEWISGFLGYLSLRLSHCVIHLILLLILPSRSVGEFLFIYLFFKDVIPTLIIIVQQNTCLRIFFFCAAFCSKAYQKHKSKRKNNIKASQPR